MSRSTPTALPVLEWSPSGARGFDAVSGLVSGPNVASVSGRLSSGQAIVALSRRTAFVRTLRVPNASPDEIGRAIGVQAAQLFPVGGSQLAIGFRLTSDVTSEGRLAVLGACPVDSMRKLHQELERTGLRALAVLPAAFGSPLFAASLGISEGAVVEETPEGIAIDVIAGGELRATRVVPTTEDLEEIKAEIERTFAIAGLESGPVIAAGGLRLPFAAKESTESTISSLGGSTKLGIHLELPELAAQRAEHRLRARARVAVLCAAAAVVAMAYAAKTRYEAADLVSRRDTTWKKSLDRLTKAKGSVASQFTKVDYTAGVLTSAFEPAQPASDVLKLICNSVPKDVWITGLTFDRGKPAFVRGAAVRNEAVTEYLDALTSLRDESSGQARFRDVKLVFANNGKVENTPVVNFSLQLFPVGNLPIVEPAKKGKK